MAFFYVNTDNKIIFRQDNWNGVNMSLADVISNYYVDGTGDISDLNIPEDQTSDWLAEDYGLDTEWFIRTEPQTFGPATTTSTTTTQTVQKNDVQINTVAQGGRLLDLHGNYTITIDGVDHIINIIENENKNINLKINNITNPNYYRFRINNEIVGNEIIYESGDSSETFDFNTKEDEVRVIQKDNDILLDLRQSVAQYQITNFVEFFGTLKINQNGTQLGSDITAIPSTNYNLNQEIEKCKTELEKSTTVNNVIISGTNLQLFGLETGSQISPLTFNTDELYLVSSIALNNTIVNANINFLIDDVVIGNNITGTIGDTFVNNVKTELEKHPNVNQVDWLQSSSGYDLKVKSISYSQLGETIIPGPLVYTPLDVAVQLGSDIEGEAASDYFGYSVSSSSDGTILAIGAARVHNASDEGGHVRVYQYANNTWTQIGLDIDGEAAGDNSGTNVSLSDDGTILAISAPYNDENGSNSGHVRVYQYANNTWTQMGSDIDGEAEDDYSGRSVSLSSDGTILAIGAPNNDGNGDRSGHVRVYQYANNTWTQMGSDIDGEADRDRTGFSVSLSNDGTILAIGAWGNDGGGNGSGHVRVYQWNGTGAWEQLGSDIDGEAANDYSGTSVSLSNDGTILAIGAPYNSGDGVDDDYPGHVRVFQWNGTDAWTQMGSDIDGEAEEDYSGNTNSISLSGDGFTLAIGAKHNDGNGDYSGHVRIYQWNGTDTWTQIGTDIDGEAANDYSGSSVSLSSDGTILAIGAPNTPDGTATEAGHVRVYKIANLSVLPGTDTTVQNIIGTITAQSESLLICDYSNPDTLITITGNEAANLGRSVSINNDATIVAAADQVSGKIFDIIPPTTSLVVRQLGQDIDGEAADDNSGYSVSLSQDGTIVAIGAWGNDVNLETDFGHVRVYQWNGTDTWTQLGSDIDGEAASDRSGWSVSLSDDGTIVAIGAHRNDENGSNSGHVRVYQYAFSTTILQYNWTQLGEDIDGEAADDESGISVSLSSDGTILAIGAPGSNDDNSGHVKVYQWNGTDTWTQIGSDIDGEANSDYSGRSISLSSDGTILAIGAPFNNGADTYSGHVRVYQWNGTDTWTQLGSDIDGEGGYNNSGGSVSLSSDGTILAIGAPGNSSYSGHVRVYQWNGADTWTQLGQDIDGEAYGDESGTSVSLNSDGTILAIGAPKNNSGHVRVYQWNGTDTWTQIGSDIDGEAAGDNSGGSVSLSSDGTILAIGADYNDGNGTTSGHVRVYTLNPPNPNYSYQESSFTMVPSDVKVSKDGSVVALAEGSVNKVDIYTNDGTWAKRESITFTSQAYNNFGTSIDLNNNGEYIVVGSPESNTNQGNATVYQYFGTGIWNQKGYHLNGQASGSKSGQNVCMNNDGTMVAIGAPGDGTNSYVRFYEWKEYTQDDEDNNKYHYTDSTRGETQTKPLLAIDLLKKQYVTVQLGQDIGGEAASDQSGYSVSLSNDGTMVAIGAPYNDDGGSNSGHVRVYRFNGSTWGEDTMNYTVNGGNGEAAGDNFGHSVSLSGDGTVLAVGAPYLNHQEPDINGYYYTTPGAIHTKVGRVYIMKWNSQYGWHKKGSFIYGETAGDEFGHSVSLNGDGTVLAVGAIRNDDGGDSSGHVLVYEWRSQPHPGYYHKIGHLNGAAVGDNFGESVSLSGDGTIVAIGSQQNDGNGSDSGHVRVYQYSSGSWTQLGQDIQGEAAGDFSGFSVSLSNDGTILAIGARRNDGNPEFQNSNSGHVRVFQYANNAWTQLGSDIDGEAADDESGYSVSLSNDGTTLAIGAPYNDGNGDNSGHVRIYQWNGTDTWTQTTSDIQGEVGFFQMGDQTFESGDRSGKSVSLSGDGTKVAIGAIFNDEMGDNSGHTRVYEIFDKTGQPLLGNNYWVTLGNDIEDIALENDNNKILSMSDDGLTIVVSCLNVVKVFTYNSSNTTWEQLGSDIEIIGNSVSLNDIGDLLSIGYTSTGGDGIKVYLLVDTEWILAGDISGENGQVVSIRDGSTIVTGSPLSGTGNGSIKIINGNFIRTTPISINDNITITNQVPFDPSITEINIGHCDITCINIPVTPPNGDYVLNINDNAIKTFSVSDTDDFKTILKDSFLEQSEINTTTIVNDTLILKSKKDQTIGTITITATNGGDVSNITIINHNTFITNPNDIISTINSVINNQSEFESQVDSSNNIVINPESGNDFLKNISIKNNDNNDINEISKVVIEPLNASENFKNHIINELSKSDKIDSIELTVSADVTGSADVTSSYGEKTITINEVESSYQLYLNGVAFGDSIYAVTTSGLSPLDAAVQLGQDIDGESGGDNSGKSVCLSSDGTVVAIGAHYNNGNGYGYNAGHVRVYQWNASSNCGQGGWEQLGSDIDGEAAGDQSGYSVSLSDDGTIVAIGAFNNDGNGDNSGHVRIYQWNASSNCGQGAWEQLGSDIDGEATNDSSGMNVSLNRDGTIVAIGAPYNDDNGNASGHVRVYQWNASSNCGQGGWEQLGGDPYGEDYGDQSGSSVSLSSDGTIVAIGAPYNDDGGSNSGHVRVYQWNASSNCGQGGWEQLGSDIDGEVYGDRSGWSISLNSDGTILAIGAPRNDGNGSDSGHVRIYQWNGTDAWTQIGTDIDGEAGYDESGFGVCLSSDGTILAIGAWGNDGNGSGAGHVRVYQWNGTDAWTQIGTDIDGEAGYDYSGTSVSLSSDGTIVAIGAPYNDDNGYQAGHVRVYKIGEILPPSPPLSSGEVLQEIKTLLETDSAETEFIDTVTIEGNTLTITPKEDENIVVPRIQVNNEWRQKGNQIKYEFLDSYIAMAGESIVTGETTAKYSTNKIIEMTDDGETVVICQRSNSINLFFALLGQIDDENNFFKIPLNEIYGVYAGKYFQEDDSKFNKHWRSTTRVFKWKQYNNTTDNDKYNYSSFRQDFNLSTFDISNLNTNLVTQVVNESKSQTTTNEFEEMENTLLQWDEILKLQTNNNNKPIIITGEAYSGNPEPIDGEYYWTQVGYDIEGDFSIKKGSLINTSGKYSYNGLTDDLFDEVSLKPTISINNEGTILAIGDPSINEAIGDSEGNMGSDVNILGGVVRIYEWKEFKMDMINQYYYDFVLGDENWIKTYPRFTNSEGIAQPQLHITFPQNENQPLPLIITSRKGNSFLKHEAPLIGNYYWTQIGYDIKGKLLTNEMVDYIKERGNYGLDRPTGIITQKFANSIILNTEDQENYKILIGIPGDIDLIDGQYGMFGSIEIYKYNSGVNGWSLDDTLKWDTLPEDVTSMLSNNYKATYISRFKTQIGLGYDIQASKSLNRIASLRFGDNDLENTGGTSDYLDAKISIWDKNYQFNTSVIKNSATGTVIDSNIFKISEKGLSKQTLIIHPNYTTNGYGAAFGWQVVISTDGLTIGVVQGKVQGLHKAYVYQKSGDNWIQKGSTLEYGTPQGWDRPGLMAITEDGSSIAFMNKVYEWNGSTWTQKGSTFSGEPWCMRMSRDGATIVYSEKLSSSSTTTNSTKVFKWSGGAWEQKGQIFNYTFSYSGCEINKDGTIFCISSMIAWNQVEHYIFEWDGSTWTQKGEKIPYVGRTVVCGMSDDGLTLLFAESDGGYTYVMEWDATSSCGQGGWVMKGEDISWKLPINSKYQYYANNTGQNQGFSLSPDGNTVVLVMNRLYRPYSSSHYTGGGGAFATFIYDNGDWKYQNRNSNTDLLYREGNTSFNGDFSSSISTSNGKMTVVIGAKEYNAEDDYDYNCGAILIHTELDNPTTVTGDPRDLTHDGLNVGDKFYFYTYTSNFAASSAYSRSDDDPDKHKDLYLLYTFEVEKKIIDSSSNDITFYKFKDSKYYDDNDDAAASYGAFDMMFQKVGYDFHSINIVWNVQGFKHIMEANGVSWIPTFNFDDSENVGVGVMGLMGWGGYLQGLKYRIDSNQLIEVTNKQDPSGNAVGDAWWADDSPYYVQYMTINKRQFIEDINERYSAKYNVPEEKFYFFRTKKFGDGITITPEQIIEASDISYTGGNPSDIQFANMDNSMKIISTISNITPNANYNFTIKGNNIGSVSASNINAFTNSFINLLESNQIESTDILVEKTFWKEEIIRPYDYIPGSNWRNQIQNYNVTYGGAYKPDTEITMSNDGAIITMGKMLDSNLSNSNSGYNIFASSNKTNNTVNSKLKINYSNATNLTVTGINFDFNYTIDVKQNGTWSTLDTVSYTNSPIQDIYSIEIKEDLVLVPGTNYQFRIDNNIVGTVIAIDNDTTTETLSESITNRLSSYSTVDSVSGGGGGGGVSQLGPTITSGRYTDLFGYSTAISKDGTIIVVSAPFEESENGGLGGGAVTRYQWTGSSWEQKGTIITPANTAAFFNTTNPFFGYSIALSDDGNRLVVGAPGRVKREDYNFYLVNQGGVGKVYVFDWTVSADWNLTDSQVIYATGHSQHTVNDNGFGYSVSISGDGTTIGVGQPFTDNDDSDDTGVVAIYRYTVGSNWSGWSVIGGPRLDNGTWIGTYDADFFYVKYDGHQKIGLDIVLNEDGTTVAIGMPGYNIGEPGYYSSDEDEEVGLVGIFDFQSDANENAGDWRMRGYNSVDVSGAMFHSERGIAGQDEDDQVGQFIAMNQDGSIIAVGELHGNWEDGIGDPAVAVYQWNSTDVKWNLMGDKIDLPQMPTTTEIGQGYTREWFGQYQNGTDGRGGRRWGLVTLSGDGTILATSNGFNIVKIFTWDGSSWSESDEIQLTKRIISSIEINKDGTRVIIGSANQFENDPDSENIQTNAQSGQLSFTGYWDSSDISTGSGFYFGEVYVYSLGGGISIKGKSSGEPIGDITFSGGNADDFVITRTSVGSTGADKTTLLNQIKTTLENNNISATIVNNTITFPENIDVIINKKWFLLGNIKVPDGHNEVDDYHEYGDSVAVSGNGNVFAFYSVDGDNFKSTEERLSLNVYRFLNGEWIGGSIEKFVWPYVDDFNANNNRFPSGTIKINNDGSVISYLSSSSYARNMTLHSSLANENNIAMNQNGVYPSVKVLTTLSNQSDKLYQTQEFGGERGGENMQHIITPNNNEKLYITYQKSDTSFSSLTTPTNEKYGDVGEDIEIIGWQPDSRYILDTISTYLKNNNIISDTAKINNLNDILYGTLDGKGRELSFKGPLDKYIEFTSNKTRVSNEATTIESIDTGIQLILDSKKDILGFQTLITDNAIIDLKESHRVNIITSEITGLTEATHYQQSYHYFTFDNISAGTLKFLINGEQIGNIINIEESDTLTSLVNKAKVEIKKHTDVNDVIMKDIVLIGTGSGTAITPIIIEGGLENDIEIETIQENDTMLKSDLENEIINRFIVSDNIIDMDLSNNEIIIKSTDTTFEITGGEETDITYGDFDYTLSLLNSISFTKTNNNYTLDAGLYSGISNVNNSMNSADTTLNAFGIDSIVEIENISYSFTNTSSILIESTGVVIAEKNDVKFLNKSIQSVTINSGFFVLNKGNKLVRLIKYEDQYSSSQYLEIDYNTTETFTDITQLVVDKENSVLFIDDGVLKGLEYRIDYEFA